MVEPSKPLFHSIVLQILTISTTSKALLLQVSGSAPSQPIEEQDMEVKMTIALDIDGVEDFSDAELR